MAVKKAAGGSEAQEGATSKKAAGVKAAAKPKAASEATPAATKAAKKAGPAPIKLSPTQADLLKKIGETAEPGYRSEKKAEQRTIDALLERKLIKKGAKHKESGTYHHLISNAGKKHLASQPGS